MPPNRKAVIKEEKYFIGIDPGVNGGIVILNNKGDVVSVNRIPESESDLLDILTPYSYNNAKAVIERLWGRPGMGGATMFKLGKVCGCLYMALTACRIPFDEATPQKWIKHYQLNRKAADSDTSWKNVLKNKAQQLFPTQKVTLWNADAFLLALYAYRNLK